MTSVQPASWIPSVVLRRGNYPLAAFCQMIPRITAEVIRWLTGYQKIFLKKPNLFNLIYCIWLYNSITFIISYYIGLIITLWINFNLYFAMMELMFTILISIRFVILTQNRIRPIELLKLSIMIFFWSKQSMNPNENTFSVFFFEKNDLIWQCIPALHAGVSDLTCYFQMTQNIVGFLFRCYFSWYNFVQPHSHPCLTAYSHKQQKTFLC